MKRYKVETDNLNWIGGIEKPFVRGYIVYEDDGYLFSESITKQYHQLPISILELHPEWFSEIKEDKEELIDHRIKYSENDLLKFGRLVRRTFNFTDSDSVVQSLLSDYKAEKSSPKEEAKESSTFTRMREYGEDINKEFTKQDMVDFLSYIHYEFTNGNRCLSPFIDVVEWWNLNKRKRK